MPWKAKQRDGKWVVVKESDGSVVGTHDNEEDANAQVKALYTKEGKMSTMHLVDAFETVNEGKPIRLIPVGTWFREGRKLDITPGRLKEIVKNFVGGLPRFKVGIDLDHAEAAGKVGDVKSIAYLDGDEAPRGPGVYITDYDLFPTGVEAVTKNGYDAVSAEVMWSLLNEESRYEDPETGQAVDNVLTGVAFTPRPFFGHKEVAIFSTGPSSKFHGDHDQSDHGSRGGGGGEAKGEPKDENKGTGKSWTRAEQREIKLKIANVTKTSGARVSDIRFIAGDEPEIEFNVRSSQGDEEDRANNVQDALDRLDTIATKLGGELEYGSDFEETGTLTITTGAILFSANDAGPEKMNTTPATTPIRRTGPEKSTTNGETVRPAPRPEWVEVERRVDYAPAEGETMADEKVVEQLAVKTAEAEQLAATNKTLSDKLTALEAERKAEKLTARKAELTAEAKAYENLSVEVTEYVEKFVALEESDGPLADWFRAQFVAHDQAAKLGKEVGTDVDGIDDPTAKFLAAVTNIQKTEKLSYDEALVRAQVSFPELATSYAGGREE